MKKKSPAQEYSSKTPVNKMDDWSRREFIKRVGIFMAAFNVPWFVRMGTMEKISKKIFGSSVAFAQGGTPQYTMALGFRAGYPMNNLFCTANDANPTTTGATRNYHSDPALTITVPAATTGGKDLYLPPQMSTFGSTHPSRAAVLTALRNSTGHTNDPSDTWLDGSGHWFNHAAKLSAGSSAPPLLTQGIVFGDADTITYNRLGPLSSEFTPIYAGSGDEVRSLFKPFTLTASDGRVISESVSNQVFDVMNSKLNADFLSTIEKRPGGSTIVSSVNKLKELLAQNLAAAITPAQADLNAMSAGVTAPNQQRLNTVLGSNAADLAEFFCTAGLLFANGITGSVGCTFNTGDWHGQNTLFQSGNDGSGTVQGQHAACWNQLLTNVLTQYDTNPIYKDASGNQIGTALRQVWFSEFSRTNEIANADNGDGGNRTIVLVGPTGSLVPGSYGNVSETLQSIQCDPETGADSGPGQLETAYQFNTIAKFLGLDLTEVGVASANRSKIVTAITG